MLPSLALSVLLAASLAADPSFQQGVTLYRQLEYEQAVFRFEEVALRPGLAPADKAEALVWLGLSWAGTGDLDAARRFFGDALRSDANVQLPADVSPRVIEVFAEAKAASSSASSAAASPTASTPSSATTSAAPAAATGGAHALPIALTSIGVIALVGSGICVVLAATDWQRATAPDAFQDEAAEAATATTWELVAAGVLAPIGLAVGGVGAVLWLNPPKE